MADLHQQAQSLIAESQRVERRVTERRSVGEKTPCPTCDSWQSTVINRSLTQREEGYLRHRRCCHCEAEYETIERFSRLIKAGKHPA